MIRFLFFLLLVGALWYGWRHYGELTQRRPGHEAVVENSSGRAMERIRLSVGGRTFVKESIPDGGRATFPFRVDEDATFTLVWTWSGGTGELTWSGGMVPRGPMLQRHFLTVDDEGSVLYRAANK
jgi:hypothetical protein